MKIAAPLLLLPLLLAACGTQASTPTTTTLKLPAGVTVAAGPTYMEAFEASVQRDLTAQGLSGTVSIQATVPKSYLNVLKVSDSTARAYLKTTYPAETGCTLDWGDTATSGVTTPTASTVSTDKADHTYAKSGTYTIKLTCGTDVKTSIFTAVVPITNLNLFDDYAWPNSSSNLMGLGGNSYNIAGYSFHAEYLYMGRNYGQAAGHTALFLYAGYGTAGFEASNGALFDVTSMTAGTIFAPTTVTAYDANGGVIGSTSFSNDGYQYGTPAETHTVNWKNVAKVRFSGNSYLMLDDMVASIHQAPN